MTSCRMIAGGKFRIINIVVWLSMPADDGVITPWGDQVLSATWHKVACQRDAIQHVLPPMIQSRQRGHRNNGGADARGGSAGEGLGHYAAKFPGLRFCNQGSHGPTCHTHCHTAAHPTSPPSSKLSGPSIPSVSQGTRQTHGDQRPLAKRRNDVGRYLVRRPGSSPMPNKCYPQAVAKPPVRKSPGHGKRRRLALRKFLAQVRGP
mmetsp:Transcript_128054/g.368916  ORF Transcript_128054/g.368916 Transcript_128054/m.368916 type:complete len:205 (+) Transcript_128054:501-1115(+)